MPSPPIRYCRHVWRSVVCVIKMRLLVIIRETATEREVDLGISFQQRHCRNKTNKLAKLGDAIAISKSETIND